MPRKKRHRGGQPGNQNARKHGFYAVNMSRQEITDFCKLVNQGVKDPALAALRTKIETSIINAPDNYRILREGSLLLVKYFQCRNGFDKKEYSLLKKTFRDVLKSAATGNIDLTKQIGSETVKKAEKLQNG